jgi:2-iminobutanoate/2-iminopropanoate deaminase
MSITRTAGGPGLPTGFPFSLACEAQGLCFISGMPALDPGGAYVAGSFTEEVDLAWRNVEAIAQAAGHSSRDVLFVQCVLADMADYDAFNAWWRKQFPEPGSAPARFTMQAAGLPFGAKIELQAVTARAE